VDSAFRQAKDLQESERLQHLCGLACVACSVLYFWVLHSELSMVYNGTQEWRARRWSRSGAAGVCRGSRPLSALWSCLERALARDTSIGYLYGPAARSRRSQGRDALGRSYFVEVNTFRPAPVRPAPAVHAPALALLFSVALLAGAYFSSAALFLRNYHLTRRGARDAVSLRSPVCLNTSCPVHVLSGSTPRHLCVMHTAC